MTNVTFQTVVGMAVAAFDIAMFFGDQEYRDMSLSTGHNPLAAAEFMAYRGRMIFGRASNIIGTAASELATRLLGPAQEAELGAGRIFTHFTTAEGATGITGIAAENLAVGQEVIVSELRYGYGQTSFMAGNAGDIFVTELGLNATSRELSQIGVMGEKQAFAIQFSEEAAFFQGARVMPQNADRSIYTIPGGAILKGQFRLIRLK